MDTSNLYLVYINPIGRDSGGLNEYEFFFSETPEIVWGEDWNVACPSACGVLLPDSTTYSHIEILKTEMEIGCAQENSCFSMQDMIDGIICLAYQRIEGLAEYPSPFRLVLHFGESYDDIITKFNELGLNFEGEENDYAEKEDNNLI